MDLHQLAANAGKSESFMKMLANKKPLIILCSLIDKECSVSELSQVMPLSQLALSEHLASLRKLKLVSTRRDAQTIYYSVVDDRVKAIIQKLYEFFCV